MGVALLVGRFLLTVVFGVAGVAKLADLPGSRRAVTGFGVPQRLAGTVGLSLPLAELALAAALIVSGSAWFGALGALLLLLVFLVAVAVALARGNKTDCHCFGQLHSAPVGWRTLARNGALAAVAAFVVLEGAGSAGPSETAWLTRLDPTATAAVTGAVLLACMIAFLLWFALQVLQQNGRLLTRLDAIEAALGGAQLPPGSPLAGRELEEGPAIGLPVGSSAPPFGLPDLDSTLVTLADLTAPGLPVLLVFSDPGCGPCNALLPELGRWRAQQSGRFTLALLSRGTPDDNRAKSEEHQLEPVLLQADREIAESYQCHGTPGAVLVDRDGRIATSLAQGAGQIQALIERIDDGGAARSAPDPILGRLAPELTLLDLDGNAAPLPALLEQQTLLLFWNPQCGFCRQMLDELKAHEQNLPEDAPALLVISSGTVEDTRADGLRSRVLLDPEFSLGAAFDAGGTPMAVLLDSEGAAASGLVAGKEAVLALARTPLGGGSNGAFRRSEREHGRG